MKSNLQIISGKYRGRKLALPAHARPTQNRARIALFNMMESLPRPRVVWDAFAGSGAFGLECISRYDANVVFTDTDVSTVRKNLFVGATVDQTDALSVINKYGPRADLIFIDLGLFYRAFRSFYDILPQTALFGGKP